MPEPTRTARAQVLGTFFVLDACTVSWRLERGDDDDPSSYRLIVDDPELDLPPWVDLQVADENDLILDGVATLASPWEESGCRRGVALRVSTSGDCYLEQLLSRYLELRRSVIGTEDEDRVWEASGELHWIRGELARVAGTRRPPYARA
jgi:hypothetical protein